MNPLDQLVMLSVIGKGSYAKVMLVRKKSNGLLYALKSMKKKYIEKKKQQNRVLMQKSILTQIKHPFLVNMNSSFQTQDKLFLLLQYCPGGELFGLLTKKKKLTQDQTKFYCAQILLALEYLHENKIIYRDLKPENVLIDVQGYIKLTDFGLSKNKVQGQSQAFSVCGTPEYLAPEIVKKEGHGRAVDWWCLGSIIYELIHGLPPFYSKNRSELFDRIKNSQPYMNKCWSKSLKSIFSILFNKDPIQRLEQIKNIKQHPWFAPIDWKALVQKRLKVPFIPVVNSQCDVSNFDKEFTQCDVHSFTESLEEGKQIEGFSFERSKQSSKMAIDEEDEGELFMMEEQQNIQFEQNNNNDNVIMMPNAVQNNTQISAQNVIKQE